MTNQPRPFQHMTTDDVRARLSQWLRTEAANANIRRVQRVAIRDFRAELKARGEI